MKIWAHTLVKNEERYIWYAVMSVIDYVEKILLWDSGSTDNTVEIIKILKREYPKKVEFNQVVQKDIEHYTQIRQEMLDKTKSDWVLILDGDEVWWDEAISEVLGIIQKKGDKIDSIVNRYVNLVGDIYHYQDEVAGRYEIDGRKGHLTIRAMNRKNIRGLHVSKPHGQQGFYDGKGTLVQDRQLSRRVFLEKMGYMHFTNMPRSSSTSFDNLVAKRKSKLKYELGNNFPLDYYYPEAFFKPRPDVVPTVWSKYDRTYQKKALASTYPKKVKRRVFAGKTGY